MADKVTFVMGDGTDSYYGNWCAVYVNGIKVHEGHWPIPFGVLRRILEADVIQVSIDEQVFGKYTGESTAGDARTADYEEGLPDEIDNLGNMAGVTVVGSQSYDAIREADQRKAMAAAARIQEHL